MATVSKILVLSLIISVLIKYVLPIGLDLDNFSPIERQRIAILILTFVPGIFLVFLWK
jgi:uncharacterized membrane protein